MTLQVHSSIVAPVTGPAPTFEGPLADVSQVGGKGRNLLQLQAAGLNVPPFVVVSVAAFEDLMGEVLPELDRLCQHAAVALAPERDACMAQVRECIVQRAFSPADGRIILASLEGQGEHFAVRSSAVDEDSAEHSFAGQLDSFLFVRRDGSLLRRIVECFASAFNDRSFAYRCDNGLNTSRIRPAVVVQRMVPATVSGLVFTGNPMSCNPDESVISATHGAGEGVVSGEMDCDLWILDEDLNIVQRQVAVKAEALFFDAQAGAGLRRRAVSPGQASAPCLTDAQIGEIARAGRRIEALFAGVPQDIEWALDASGLFVLQARPVSNLSHIRKGRPRTILDNSNIVESFSGVTSPLTFSFASRVYQRVYEQFYGLFGVPAADIRALRPVFRNMLAYHRGHVYYNLNSWYRSLSLLPFFEVNKGNFDASIGVQSQSSAGSVRQARLGGRWRKGLFMAQAAARIVFFHLRRDALCRRFAHDFDAFMAPYLSMDFNGLDNQQLLALYDQVEIRLLDRWLAPIVNDFFTETFHGLLRQFLDRHVATDAHEASRLHNDLLCGQGGVASVRPTRLLLEVATWVEGQPVLREAFKDLSVEALKRCIEEADTPDLRSLKSRIDAYREEFGFRCINELKLEETSIKDDPTFVVQALKNYVVQGASRRQGHEAHDRETARRAERRVQERCGKNLVFRALSAWLIRHSRACVKEREELRFYRTKVFGFLRGITRAMGRNFVAQGVLQRPEDIYLLSLDEVFGLIERRAVLQDTVGPMLDLRRDEQRRFGLEDCPAPRLQFYGELTDANMVKVSSSEAGAEGSIDEALGIFKGTSCSSGVVEAEVRVVHDTRDVQLGGEILVTLRTDPGWVPFFPCISGLIVERGSVLSHSAVVAREMGIPAVVGLRGITQVLKDRDRVRLDGAAGLVTRLPSGGEVAPQGQAA